MFVKITAIVAYRIGLRVARQAARHECGVALVRPRTTIDNKTVDKTDEKNYFTAISCSYQKKPAHSSDPVADSQYIVVVLPTM